MLGPVSALLVNGQTALVQNQAHRPTQPQPALYG